MLQSQKKAVQMAQIYSRGLSGTLSRTIRSRLLCTSSALKAKNLRPESFEPEKIDHIFVEKVQDNRPLVNDPFVKNLFTGTFDKTWLVFPEVCEKEELEDLEAMAEPVEKFFDSLDSTSMDVNAEIPSETLQGLKDLGLFGLQIPEDYGGLGMNATKYARIAEITGRDGGISVTLAAHQAIGLKGILIAGNTAQKEKYLPTLASGEKVAAFCLTEPKSGSDAASIETKATLSADGKTYSLSGSKIWISNGGIADVFTVFAKTRVQDDFGEFSDKVTALIVERSFGGVSNGPPEDKLGIRGSNTCEVFFDETPVPVENVLGEPGGGFKVAMNILNGGRFSMGTSCAGALKKLIEQTIEHAMFRKQFGKNIVEFDMIRQKFSSMHSRIYAMEAMGYMTAGIIDTYQQPDASVEAAIVKVYSSENTWWCVSECLQILGGLGYMKAYPYERYLRDARILPIFEGTNEILRLYISLTGLDFATKSIRDTLKKFRDPMNNVGFMWKAIRERRQSQKSKKSTWMLHEHVHPLFRGQAETLESQCKRFKYIIEQHLSIHKEGIIERQMDLARLSDVAMDLYGCTAVLARASRSISIGLPNNDQEKMLAGIFCFDAEQRIEENLKQLSMHTDRSGANVDELHQRVADHMIKHKGCFTSSPLARMW